MNIADLSDNRTYIIEDWGHEADLDHSLCADHIYSGDRSDLFYTGAF